MAIRSTGDIIAENYIISSSVTYMTQSFSSGSTTFGNSADDKHVFTGSLQVSSSVAKESYIIGTNVGIGTTNPGVALEVIGSVSGSHNSTGSFGQLKTGDIELENERGHWRIIEEEEYLSIYNVKSNKKFKFVLEEIE